MSSDPPVLVYATFPDGAVAERIATSLVERRLIACANIFPPMTSIYVWAGKLNRDAEVAAIIKTRRSLATEVTNAIRAGHPYTNPAIVVLAIDGGSAPFLAWLGEQTAATGS
jgi:periplasmic divalent cation tolerance protein